MFNPFKKKEKKFEIKPLDIDDLFNEIMERKPTIFDKIRWKYRDIRRFIREFPYNVKNLIKWAKIIWNDAEFDQAYLFEIMLFKLKNMEEFYRSGNTMSADALIYADDIAKARRLLQYLRDEQYEEDGMKPYYDKYPIGIKNPEKNSEEAHKFFFECCEECERLYQEKMKEFCDLFTERVRYWWD